MVMHVLVGALALAAADRPKLALLDVQPVGVAPEVAAALTAAASQELSARGFFEVITTADIQTLLGMERQKQVLGCTDTSAACSAELMGALGSRFVLSGTVTKLGSALQLQLQMVDTTKGQAVARSVRIAEDVRTLVEQLPWQLAEATATPLPPAPSRVLPFSLIGVGAAALIGGGVLGINALTRDFTLRDELSGSNTSALKSSSFYQSEAASIGTLKTASLAAVIGGAALVAGGIFLLPRDSGRASVAFVPGLGGFAIVGVWP